MIDQVVAGKAYPTSIILDAVLTSVPWNREDCHKYFSILNAVAIRYANFEIIPVSEQEYEEETRSEEFGMWLPIQDETISKSLEDKIKVLQLKGITVPYDPVTKKLKIQNTRYYSQSLINMRYGKIDIHRYGSQSTLIWVHMNQKLYRSFPEVDRMVMMFGQYLSQNINKDVIYLFSNDSNVNYNKLVYFSRGDIQYDKDGKEVWKVAEEAYGISNDTIFDKCFSNLDVQLAPADIQIVENQIKNLAAYIPYVAGARDPDDPRITEDGRKDIKEKVEILRSLMNEKQRIEQLLPLEPEVETIFFRLNYLKNINLVE